MKIGIIALGRRGSMCAIAYELAASLSPRAEVFAVVSSDAENIALWRSSRVPTIEVGTFTGWLSAAVSIANVRKVYLLARRIRALQPDVLIYPYFHAWYPLLRLFLSRIRFIFFVHDATPHPGFLPRLISLLEDLLLRRADKCIVLSKASCAELKRRGVDQGRIAVIPHPGLGYYQEQYAHTRPIHLNRFSGHRVLFFGRLTAYKGLEILLRAFQELEQRADVELRIVGEGSLLPYAPLLAHMPHVQVINRWVADDEVGGFFSNATIVVLPYTSASQSGVIPIAAMFRLPVIATRAGGLPEQIIDGQTGVLVAPGSVEQLVAAIERLLDSPAEGRRLGYNLYRDYHDHKNWKNAAVRVLEICRGTML